MYKMKADGVVFYDPSSDDMSLHVLSPKAKFELNEAGSLEFVILPGNVMYDGLHKLKTIITLEQDGEIIFRGRVVETVTDTYNQKEVYCEGDLAYLYDSLVRPYNFNGKASDLFRQLVTKHNEQVEDYKQFEIGMITAVDDDDTVEPEGKSYTDTLSEMKSMLVERFGGYLRVRREGGVRYLDYVDALNQACSQEIKFGVNIVDVENKINVQDVFTVLVPLGKKAMTIETVNGGKDYIEDTELVAKYGRIVKANTWDDVSDPNELLRLGREYMDEMKAETTLVFTAVDLHACGVDVDSIKIGDTVKLNSPPHGIDKEDICAEIELDIERPEKSEYIFGIPRKSLTASTASVMNSVSGSVSDHHIWLTETEAALNINVEAINTVGHRTTQLEIDVDAAKEAITFKASQEYVDILEEKHNEVVLRLDAAEGAITAKADKVKVEALETQISGLVTMEEFESGIGAIETNYSEYIMTKEIDAGSAEIGKLDVTESAAILSLSCGTLEVGGSDVATQDWVNGRGFLRSLPSTAATKEWVEEQKYATNEALAALARRVTALESSPY